MSGTYPRPDETSIQSIVQSIRDLYAGRNNCSGQFTLAVAPATSTVVRAPNAGPDSCPQFAPLTAHAAAEVGGGTMYISSRGAGTFTVTHSSSAFSDRTFAYTSLG
jgi:hypothetical protein